MMLVQAGCRALPLYVRSRVASTVPGFCRVSASVCQQHSRHYSVISRDSKKRTRRRFEADEDVKKMSDLVKNGIITQVHTLTLNTADPVSPDLFEAALKHLNRKVESLQLCLPEQNAQMWVTDMETPKIDFEVKDAVQGGHLEAVINATVEDAYYSYNLAEGPLWRARLLVCPPDEPCHLPEFKDAFPHQYHLVMDFHHAVNDGLSILVITQTFFTILDGLLNGAEIDDTLIGELCSRRNIREMEAKIRDTLEKNPERLEALLKERQRLNTRLPLVIEAFGEPQEPSPTTNILEPWLLDDKLLEMFNAKCKAHKVTFNSGFIAVMNTALVELVREAGVVRDSYMIATRHPVDARRYMNDVKAMVLGFHGVPMTHIMMTPWNVRKNFWKYAAEFDSSFRGHLREMRPLEERVLESMMQSRALEPTPKFIYDYLISNIYSPRIKPFGSGSHVQLTNYIIYSSLNKQLSFGIGCGVTGFQDHVQALFGKSSECITTANAMKLLDKVISVFSDIAKSAY